jgi:AcrR family transcriptional regulator
LDILTSKTVQARSLIMIEKVLDATETLVARQGIGSLTMDAVAAEAGVSKGAVLHHFRSKDALVEAMASRKLLALQSEMARQKARISPDDPYALAGMARQAQYSDERAFPRAILVAAVENSNALGLFREMVSGKLAEVEREAGGRDLDPLLLFSVLGLLLTKSLGLLDLPPEKAEAYLETVLRHVSPTARP